MLEMHSLNCRAVGKEQSRHKWKSLMNDNCMRASFELQPLQSYFHRSKAFLCGKLILPLKGASLTLPACLLRPRKEVSQHAFPKYLPLPPQFTCFFTNADLFFQPHVPLLINL